jgi:hypothetical protein
MSSETKTEYEGNFIEDAPRGEEVVIAPPNWEGEENPRWKQLSAGKRGTMCPDGTFISYISSSVYDPFFHRHRGITFLVAMCRPVKIFDEKKNFSPTDINKRYAFQFVGENIKIEAGYTEDKEET